MITCQNCDSWCEAVLLSKKERRCLTSGKVVESTTKSCKYFNPIYFYCDKFQQRLTFNQCLARRRNEKGFASYQDCKKCRQFDLEIREIIQEYWLDMKRIVNARNRESSDESLGSGKIKRRNKGNPENKRKLKRREKPPTKENHRKIKRRNKPVPPKKDNLDPGPEYSICPKCNQKAMKDNCCRVCTHKIDDIEVIHNLLQKSKRKLKRRSK